MSMTRSHSVTSPRRPYNDTEETTNSQYDVLCSRSHSNTAFVGVQPYGKLLLFSPGDCFKSCIESFPRCAAVVFYNLHEGDLNNVCYTFDKNSADENVALVPEKPANPHDVIRALEIGPGCHIFDPVPPPREEFVKSTDTVSETKRVETVTSSTSQVKGSGPWSAWTYCSPRNPYQIRSQPCDYGRLINRRRCHYGSRFPAYRGAVIIHANIPYPPMPYIHPECHTQEYDQIMTQHVDQMRQICCVRPEPNTREVVKKPTTFIPTCRQVCVPQGTDYMHIYANTIGDHETQTDVGKVGEAEWMPWTEWSVCSSTCDHGTQNRYRTCSRVGCKGNSLETRSCQNLLPCKTWAEWSQWSDCRATCGTGERVRSRFCYLGKNQCSGSDFQVESCEVQPCAEWSPWTDWSLCSATCDQGTQTRTRYCTGNMDACVGNNVETKSCIVETCSFWSPWLAWSTCSESCGIGVRERKRICLGESCMNESPISEERCSGDRCPVWNDWSEWSPCSVTCGSGFQKRDRICASMSMDCIGERSQAQVCGMTECTVWSEWLEWSACSATCGRGTATRRRLCVGPDCFPEDEVEEQVCNNEPCSEWADWLEWSECSASCGHGMQTRSRSCLGKHCIGRFEDAKECHLEKCSAWSFWTEWQDCSATCGNGRQIRRRTCLTGNDCIGQNTESRHCATDIPCVEWSKWGEWTPCDKSCGIGERTRQRQCLSDGYPSAGCLGPSMDRSVCLDEPCCTWSAWGDWTGCDRMCGGGKMTRVRQCQRPGDNQAECVCPGSDKDSRDCHMEPCPIPSQTITSRNNTQIQHGVVINQPETQPPCYSYPCYPAPEPPAYNHTNCHWTSWCDWSPCPTTCNYGMTRRHRYCYGDERCVCNGPSLEKVSCAGSEQCRKKK